MCDAYERVPIEKGQTIPSLRLHQLGNVPYMSKFVLDVRNDAVEFRNYIYILQKESNKRHNFVFFKLLGGGDIVHPLVPFTAKRKQNDTRNGKQS